MRQFEQLAICVSTDMPDNKYIYDSKYNTSKMFKLVTKENRKEHNGDMPILNYSNYHVGKLIETGYNPNLIFNNTEAKDRVSSKIEWHRMHEESGYTPNTVYTPNDIDNLVFPIIAKPDNRYAGQGIMVYDSLEAAKKEDLTKFDVFSEKFEIKEEFRVFCWKGIPLIHMYRVPSNDETKSLTKDINDKLEFNYELGTEELSQDIREVVNEFASAHKDLDFYSIDFAVTEDDIPYVIEMSSEPGPCFGVLGHVYREMYNECNETPLTQEAEDQINTWIKQDIDATIASDKNRFKIR